MSQEEKESIDAEVGEMFVSSSTQYHRSNGEDVQLW